MLASLLVARIWVGPALGRPSSSAGSWISPPPPTTASTNPAATAANPSRTSTVVVGSSTGHTLGWRRADRVAAPLDDRDPVRARGRTVRRGGDLRVRHPRRGAEPHGGLDLGTAAGAEPRRDRRVRRRRGGARRGPLPPRGRRAPRPRPDPGGHPGPLRGLRGRRDHGRRGARPPRLLGRGA